MLLHSFALHIIFHITYPFPSLLTINKSPKVKQMALTLRAVDGAGDAVLVAAQYQNVTVVVEETKVVDSLGNTTVELETRQGSLRSVATCLRYIANLSAATSFGGSTPFTKAKVDQWIDFAFNEILPRRLASSISAKRPMLQTLVNIGIRGSVIQRSLRARCKNLIADLSGLNDILLTRSFLIGNSVSAADVAVASAYVNYDRYINPQQKIKQTG